MEKSLYDITTEQRELISEIEMLDGELTETMQERLAINEGQLQHKSIAYLSVIQNKESFNSLVDAEIKRLQALKKRNNNIIDRLKDNLLNAVKLFGEFSVGLTSFGTRKSTVIEVDEFVVNSLPKDYKTIKVTETPNKALLKKALKSGEVIEGVRSVEKLHLKIN